MDIVNLIEIKRKNRIEIGQLQDIIDKLPFELSITSVAVMTQDLQN